MTPIATERVYAMDLQTPAIINHRTFLGTWQTKRVDQIEFDVTTDPRVLHALGLDHGHQAPDAVLMRLTGDNVHADGSPMGDIRGWQSYVWSDDHIFVLAEA